MAAGPAGFRRQGFGDCTVSPVQLSLSNQSYLQVPATVTHLPFPPPRWWCGQG